MAFHSMAFPHKLETSFGGSSASKVSVGSIVDGRLQSPTSMPISVPVTFHRLLPVPCNLATSHHRSNCAHVMQIPAVSLGVSGHPLQAPTCNDIFLTSSIWVDVPQAPLLLLPPHYPGYLGLREDPEPSSLHFKCSELHVSLVVTLPCHYLLL